MSLKVILVVLVLMGMTSSAQALDFSAVGAVTVSNYSLSPSMPTSSGVAFGTGATAAINLNPFFSLESGALFLGHSFTLDPGTSTSVTYKYLDIPVLLRFSPIGLVALNGGIYYGIPTSTTMSTTLPSGTTVTSSGTNSTDFGFLLGGGVRWPIAPLFRVRFDLLYEFGLANIGSGGVSQYSRNLDILAGLMLDIW